MKALTLIAITWTIACSLPSSNQEAKTYTPAERLRQLEEGAARFASGRSKHPRQTPARVHEIENGQHPFAIVVACSDSRVSPEIIFDQGLGDLFVLRTAGNLIDNLVLGSIEYAVEHLGASVVVVLGHSECGAVKALTEGGEACGHIRDIVEMLAAEEEEQTALRKMGRNTDACVQGNILHGVRQIKANFETQIAEGRLLVAPMLYDVHTGAVTTLSEADLAHKFARE